MELRNYQQDLIDYLIESDKPVECIGLPTGSGKTFIFSFFAAQMALEFGVNVVIAVHREELLMQTKKQIEDKMGIIGKCGIVSSKNQLNKQHPIQIVMVETISRRKRDLEYLKENYQILIVDECHIGNFFKIIKGFKRVIGFSATPISSKKSIPLQKYYEHLHYPVQISNLIEENYLCKVDTWVHPQAVGKSELKMDATNTDYDLNQMGEVLSTPKYVDALAAYVKKFCANKKTIIYNSNIAHSMNVTATLKSLGYNVYHVDGETPKREREWILGKLMSESEIIVCNVGVLTTGFDCPEVEVIILNRRTKSLSLYIQMAGRGSRLAPSIGKDKFTVLDMCNNYEEHNGAWQDDIEWQLMFTKIKKEKKGVAPQKQCKECGFLNHAKTAKCEQCGYKFESVADKVRETDPNLILLERIQTGNSEFSKLILQQRERNYNKYFPVRQLVSDTFYQNRNLDSKQIYQLVMAEMPIWCKINNIKMNPYVENYIKDRIKEFSDSVNYQPNKNQ